MYPFSLNSNRENHTSLLTTDEQVDLESSLANKCYFFAFVNIGNLSKREIARSNNNFL